MAKWGEGDPRWIVEERADATNVNNWHWSEKNATHWSKDKLKSLLEGLKLCNDLYNCSLTSLTKCEGEATANNRKAKLIFFYEWVIELEWSGKYVSSDNKTKFTGKVDIVNLSEENSPEDIDIDVSVSSNSNDAYKIKEFVRTEGVKKIRDQLAIYIKDLRQEFSANLILPSKSGASDINKVGGDANKPVVNKAKEALNQAVESKLTVSDKNDKQPLVTKKLTFKEEFHCSTENLFQIFTTQELMSAFSRSQAVSNPSVGGEFSLCGGVISGFFDEIVPSSKLVMRWRHNAWPANHFSVCTLTFTPKDGSTQLELVQTSVPEKEVDFTKNSWRQHYFQAIKQTFGFNGPMY